MKKKYDLYQSQNLRYELPVFNKDEHPTIKWKTKMMRKFTYPGKHIAVKIIVATHIIQIKQSSTSINHQKLLIFIQTSIKFNNNKNKICGSTITSKSIYKQRKVSTIIWKQSAYHFYSTLSSLRKQQFLKNRGRKWKINKIYNYSTRSNSLLELQRQQKSSRN